jgi:hypothetical protein
MYINLLCTLYTTFSEFVVTFTQDFASGNVRVVSVFHLIGIDSALTTF